MEGDESMRKYDCSRTLDYSHEFDRMCQMYHLFTGPECDGCPHRKICSGPDDITQKHIDLLQKWSDEHPEITRKEKFEQIMKEAGLDYRFCNFKMPKSRCVDSCAECKKYWNGEWTDDKSI